MSLQPLQLDTVNWQQMVTAIQARIIPNSKGKWTLQAPVDPGVTLLELFAWLLDQRIYWINQLPNSLVLSVLNLLGESPQPAQPAITVLQLSDAAQPPRDFPVAAAATLMRLDEVNPPILFTLDEDLTILPVQSISVTLNGTDRTNDLAQGRPVALLNRGQSSSEVRFLLNFTKKISSPAPGQFFSLMLQLDTPADLYPQWSPEAVDGIVPPATLSWSYSNSAASSTPAVVLSSTQVDDGTAGLRRSGLVRFALPLDWQPEPAGPDSAVTTYAITLSIMSAAYTFLPFLTNVQTNVVTAQHLWKRSLQLKPSLWPSLPGNVIPLPGKTATSTWKESPPIEESLVLTVTGPSGSATQWTQVPDLTCFGPTDNVYVVDRALAQIRFGDGLAGRLPVLSPTAAAPIVVTYAAGGGAAGNIGENSSWAAVQEDSSAPNLFFTAKNLVAGDGGTESETLQQGQQRSMAALNELNRAVTKSDYENLAVTTPGVAIRRAFAAVGYHPEFPCSIVASAVTVFVLSYAPRIQTDGSIPTGSFVAAPQPDPGTLQAVCARLSAAKLLGGQVFASAPAYRKVWLTLTIAVDFPLSSGRRQEVIDGLQSYLDPLVGGDEHNGWPFGDPLRPSALLKIAQEILGDSGDVLTVAVHLDGSQKSESCKDTTIRPHELVHLVHADIQTQQRPSKRGGLR